MPPRFHPSPRPAHLAAVLGWLLLALAPRSASAQWPVDGVPIGPAPWLDIPGLAPDGDGGVYAAWVASPVGATAGLYGAHVRPNGSLASGWPGSGLRLRDVPPSLRYTLTASDETGGVLAAWFNPFLGASNPLLTVGRHDVSGAPDPAWPLDGTLVWDEPRPIIPRMIPDGDHGALLAWFVRTNAANDPSPFASRVDLRASRVAASGALADGWPADGLLLHATPLSAAPSQIADLRIARTTTGGLFVAWRDSADGIGDVHVLHVGADGALVSGWPDGGRAVCDVASLKSIGGLTPDVAAGAYVTWSETRAGTARAFVTRIDAHGATVPGWPASGLAAPGIADPAFALDAEPDGAGGVIVLVAVFSGGQIVHRLVRLGPDGSPASGWPAGGAPVDGSNGGSSVDLAGDGVGGGYVTWRTSGDVAAELRITRVDGTGGPAAGWPAGGRLVAAQSGSRVTLIADGRGGAIVGWTPGSPTTSELRVQRYGPDGNPTTDVDTRASGAGLMPAWPNPFRSTVQLGFTLPMPTTAVVEIVDVTGRRVRALSAGPLDAGEHRLWWDGRDDDGRVQRPGLYWVRARWPGFEASRKVVRSF